MMNSQKTADAIARLAQVGSQALIGVQADFTAQFEAGIMVSAGSLERLIAAQATANLAAQLQTRWNRAGMAAIEAWLEDAAEILIEGNVGGTSSPIQNEAEKAERKALQAAYKALSRCRD
jgi:hypothetical protein